MNKIIQLLDIYKKYGEGEACINALHSVNLSVERGEFIVIVGASGSGKTTLLNIIGCLDTATSGTYLLNGSPIEKMSDNQLSQIRNEHIGFIFQNFNLVESLDALENVELPLIYRKMPKDERRRLAYDALERVGLETRLHHRPCQMSGGQQQRVAIARAIAAHPSILLADEPTGNLDSQSGRQVMSILSGLNREGRTLILITHDDAIARKGGRVMRVQDGYLSYAG